MMLLHGICNSILTKDVQCSDKVWHCTLVSILSILYDSVNYNFFSISLIVRFTVLQKFLWQSWTSSLSRSYNAAV